MEMTDDELMARLEIEIECYAANEGTPGITEKLLCDLRDHILTLQAKLASVRERTIEECAQIIEEGAECYRPYAQSVAGIEWILLTAAAGEIRSLKPVEEKKP